MPLNQAAYRFGSNDGAETTHGWLAEINTPISRDAADASTFLLRFLIQASGAAGQANCDFQFQVRKNGGADTNITTTSANVRAVSTTVFTNAQNTTSRLGGSGTFESSSQGCTHDGLSGGTAFDIVTNGRGETVCALQLVPADLLAGDLLEFRLLVDGAQLASYPVTPSLTITAALPPIFGSLAATEAADLFVALGTLGGVTDMALYLELHNLGNDPDLRNRVQIAVLVEANTIIRAAAPTDAEVAWAKNVIANPGTWALRVLWLALAQNKDLTLPQIAAVTDAQLQTGVAATIAALARGEVLGG